MPAALPDNHFNPLGETPYLAQADLWIRRIWPVLNRDDALDFLCHLPHRCGRTRPSACLLWRSGGHYLGCDQRSSGWDAQRPLPLSVWPQADLFINLSHSVWIKFHPAVVSQEWENQIALLVFVTLSFMIVDTLSTLISVPLPLVNP